MATATKSEGVSQMSRIEDLLRALLKATLAERMSKEIGDAKLRLLYENTGKKTVAELARATGFSTGKISGIWKHWESIGMVAKDGARYRRLV